LNEPFNLRRLSAKWIDEKIASLRKEFVSEFVNTTSVPVLRALSPGSEQGIVEQLNSVQIELRSLASAAPIVVARGVSGSATLRTMAGAGLGAAAALMLVAMQIHPPPAEPARSPASGITHPGTRSGGTAGTGGGATQAPEVKLPAPATTPPGASASPSPPPPASAAGLAPSGRHHFVQSALIWIVGGTLGALFGAFVVCFSPPLMFERLAQHLMTLTVGSRRSGTYRGRVGVAVGVAIAAGAIAWTGRMLTDPKPVWTAFGAVCAVALILAARFLTVPRGASSGPVRAIKTLQRELIAESNYWSVLAGCLVSRNTEFRAVSVLKNIIVEHRARSARGEDILQLVEQELGLSMGGQRPEASGSELGDFVWAAEHERLYDTFGIVEIGDRVKVKVPPRTVTSPSGAKTVIQRGLVSRHREH